MEPKTWNIDTAHSGIHVSVRHMVFAKVRGRFGTWTGKVELDPDDLTRGKVEAEIDAASIDTGVAYRVPVLRSRGEAGRGDDDDGNERARRRPQRPDAGAVRRAWLSHERH